MAEQELPWDERITMLSIHPDAASRDDIARLATELMECQAAAAERSTTTENRIWLPEDAIGLVTTSSELENVEGDWWVREAHVAEGQAAQGLNLFRQLVSGKNALRELEVFPCNSGEHDADCECFWEQCEAWAKADAASAPQREGELK